MYIYIYIYVCVYIYIYYIYYLMIDNCKTFSSRFGIAEYILFTLYIKVSTIE